MALENIDKVLTPEIWGKLVGIHMKEYRTPMRALLANIGMQAELSYGSKVPLVYPDAVLVNDRGELGSPITYPVPKNDKSFLTIDQNKYASMLIPKEIRSTLNNQYINQTTKQIAVSMANYIEKALIDQVKAKAKMDLTLPALDVKSVKQIFIQAKLKMNKAEIPAENRWLVMDDETFALLEDWLTTIPFQKADTVLNTGQVYSLYGLNIALSSYADGIYFGHKTGLLYAFSLEEFESEYDMDLKSQKMSGQIVYGSHAPKSGEWLGKVTVTKKTS